MGLKDDLISLVEEGNVARKTHIKEVNAPGGLSNAVVWIADRTKADYKGFLAKQILTDLNNNGEERVIKCHLDSFKDQILGNEMKCQSSDKFLDALCETKRQAVCEMIVLLKPHLPVSD
jgi:hypothetical protein